MRLISYQCDIAPNLGAMIRISACFGVKLDIIEPCGFPLSIKALRRSAMDYADIADLLHLKPEEVMTIVGVDINNSDDSGGQEIPRAQ